MLQLRRNPFSVACAAAALFGSAICFRQWLKQNQQPLSLIYDEKLEKASNFDLGSYYDKVEKKLIEISNRNLKLKKFLLNTSFDYKYESQVIRLIRYAVNSNVQELDLSFCFDYGPDVEIVLDESFFINSHLTHLKLSCAFPHPTHTVSWENLRSLSLSRLSLTEDFIQKILSGSPLLETFKLDNCDGDLWNLDITSNSVKNFEISGNRQFREGRIDVKLKAPNIVSLTIKGSLPLNQLLLFDVTSLVEANLDYTEDDIGDLSPTEEEEMIYRHLQDLTHVKELKLGEICSEVRSRLEAKGPPKDDDYYDEYVEDFMSMMKDRMSRCCCDDDLL